MGNCISVLARRRAKGTKQHKQAKVSLEDLPAQKEGPYMTASNQVRDANLEQDDLDEIHEAEEFESLRTKPKTEASRLTREGMEDIAARSYLQPRVAHVRLHESMHRPTPGSTLESLVSWVCESGGDMPESPSAPEIVPIKGDDELPRPPIDPSHVKNSAVPGWVLYDSSRPNGPYYYKGPPRLGLDRETNKLNRTWMAMYGPGRE
ncbi:hypothetical protein MBM_01352 [Drepanopeziza brunnea f. sp. 'multigermtubi' MB_m1]|uniref:Uncharacterized protein n=1 Tax=Marssonina brunnea f. sp. multigermtubi (strain MB_m1) TaxID=1072389 RepID=K1WST8_MARBU|nr:uncharacterized protein MBM_01352 [Drepanopeziza brunnea f. sp. 'multigermtubi' MB_m1]EKD20670.1 hypothetical protein MBM_01352 [Drepanopeziza brunnea f. sp. 'multigermtubi' MB_m1]